MDKTVLEHLFKKCFKKDCKFVPNLCQIDLILIESYEFSE